MKRTVKILYLATFLSCIIVSCNNEPSLQRYFVDHQEQPNFISQDIPVSMVKIDRTNFTKAQNEAFKSVRRLNFLGFNLNETNKEIYASELDRLTSILKQEKYQDLVEFSDKGRKVLVKYIGNDEEADEFIVLVSANNMGFAVVRILGNDMSPQKMMTLAETINTSSIDETQMQDILNFFN